MNTNRYNPVLECVRHEYPFLVYSVFDCQSGNFYPLSMETFIAAFICRYIEQNINEGKTDATLMMFIQELRNGSGIASSRFFGTDNLGEVGRRLDLETEIFIDIACLNVKFAMRRFGECVGIKPIDGSSQLHKQAYKILEEMACPSGTSRRSLVPFVHHWAITVPRWREFDRDQIDVITELASLERYIPDVKWFREDAHRITGLLYDDYIHSLKGVQIGSYYDIPVWMQVLYGDEKKDSVWRKGAVTHDPRTLRFDSNQNDIPYIRYFVQVANEDEVRERYHSIVDHRTEQLCLEGLAKTMMAALSVRERQDAVFSNLSLIAWKTELQG